MGGILRRPGGRIARLQQARWGRGRGGRGYFLHPSPYPAGRPDKCRAPITGPAPGQGGKASLGTPGKRVASDRAPGPWLRRGAGHLVLEPSTLRQAGRGEEGARPEAPRARRCCRVPLFLGASSRAVASRGRLRLRGGGGEREGPRGRGGGASQLLDPRPPEDGVRGLGRPLRPGPGAPPCQGSGPRGDLERASSLARTTRPDTGAFSSHRAGQLPSAQPRPTTPDKATPLSRPSRPRPQDPGGRPRPSPRISTLHPGASPGGRGWPVLTPPRLHPRPHRSTLLPAPPRVLCLVPAPGPPFALPAFHLFLCVCVSVHCVSF